VVIIMMNKMGLNYCFSHMLIALMYLDDVYIVIISTHKLFIVCFDECD